jgi:hypothetical protein
MAFSSRYPDEAEEEDDDEEEDDTSDVLLELLPRLFCDQRVCSRINVTSEWISPLMQLTPLR